MILITGAMGFIGMEVANQLAGEGDLLLGYNRTKPSEAELPEGIRSAQTEQLDISSPYAVARAVHEHGVDSIVHMAVPGLGVLPAAEEATTAVSGLLNVLEAAHSAGLRRVTVASSVAVYGGLETGPYHEDMALPVHSPTSTSAMKKAEEILALHYSDRTGLEVVLLRIAVIYGPRYRTLANMAGRLVHRAMRPVASAHGPDVLAAPQGPEAQDLCYVVDCARAISRIHTARQTEHRIYNIGTGRPAVTADELLEAIRLVLPEARLPMITDQHRVPTGTAKFMDTKRAQDEFDVAPAYSIEDGVRAYVDWLREHDL